MAAWWTGTHLASLLCSAAVVWAIVHVRSHALAISAAFVVVFAPWRSSMRSIRTMSVVTLLGLISFPFTIFVAVFVARLMSISVLALSGLRFLFFQAAQGMPVPHVATVHGGGVTV